MASSLVFAVILTCFAAVHAFVFNCAPLDVELNLSQSQEDFSELSFCTPWYPHLYQNGIQCVWKASDSSPPYSATCNYNFTKPESSCESSKTNHLVMYYEYDNKTLKKTYCGVGNNIKIDNVVEIEIITADGEGGRANCDIELINSPNTPVEYK